MTCAQIQDLFSDLFDDALDADRRRNVESHLAACATCAADYRVFRNGITALNTTASIEAPDRFVDAVTTTLRIQRVQPPPADPPAPATPRRHTSAYRQPAVPERASWAPLGMAAGVITAFALGFFVTRSRDEDEISRLRDENRRLQESRPTSTAADLPKGVVIDDNGKQVPIATFLSRKFADAGLVKEGDRWVSQAMKEEVERNAALVKERIRKLEDDLAAAQSAPRPPVTEEEALRQLKLVKWGDWYVTAEWKAALDARKVLTPDGEWRAFDEVVAAIMKENRLVQHQGRWVREEELAALQAQQFIRKSELVSLDGPAVRALDGLEIAPPLTFRNLTLYPLLAAEDRSLPVTTLHEALVSGKFEISDKDAALSVRAKNDGGTDVMLMAGALLVGGRYGRVVARDTLVPAGKTVDVRVFDAEPSASPRPADKFARESGHYVVTGAVRRAMAADAGQGWVWNAVASSLVGLRKATSPADLYKAYAAAIIEYRAQLMEMRTAHPRATGVAVAIGERLEYVEVFASPTLFGAYFERILQAAALEAAMRKDDAKGGTLLHSMAMVKQFVESAFGFESETVDDSVVIRSGARTAGRSLVRDGVALHVSLYVESNAPEPKATLEISPSKVNAVLADYEARLKAAPAVRKPAVVREIAGLPQKRATQHLLSHLDDPDLRVRAAVIEALGRRGDADAVKPLLAIFKEARRDAALFTASTEALARIGHEDAITPFLDVLESKDAQAANIVAERVAMLLLQQKKQQSLERAIGRMIDALEMVTDRVTVGGNPVDVGYHGTLSAALRSTTGLPFVAAVDYRNWWNDPLNRKKFLEERQK